MSGHEDADRFSRVVGRGILRSDRRHARRGGGKQDPRKERCNPRIHSSLPEFTQACARLRITSRPSSTAPSTSPGPHGQCRSTLPDRSARATWYALSMRLRNCVLGWARLPPQVLQLEGWARDTAACRPDREPPVNRKSGAQPSSRRALSVETYLFVSAMLKVPERAYRAARSAAEAAASTCKGAELAGSSFPVPGP